MTKIINKKGKVIKEKYLPKIFCGGRLPYIQGEYMLRGETFPNSSWGNYTLKDILEGDCGTLLFDGKYLTKL